MKRVMVIGCPGSGKSVFSRALSEKTGLPVCHLDMLYWNVDGTNVDREVFDERLQKCLENEEWIIDGNFGRTMRKRIERADTVFFLDYPTEVCLEGVRSRIGKKRDDIPWIEQKENEEFMDFIRQYKTERRPDVLSLLEEYGDRNIIIFKSRSEGDNYLSDLK